jgi:hypothetical protein
VRVRNCQVRHAARRRSLETDPVWALVLVCALAGWPTLAESRPLPTLALSLPGTTDLKTALAAFGACDGTQPSSVVAPVLSVDLGDSAQAPVDLAAVDRLARGVGPRRSVLMHLRIEVGGRTSDRQILEATLQRRVTQLVAALPTDSESVRGVILEIGTASQDSSLTQFTLALLVLQLKAEKPSLEVTVAFPPGLLRAEPELSRRITAYADVIGLVTGSDWQRDAEWARGELGKPLTLKVGRDVGLAANAVAAEYLSILLGNGGALVDTLWFERSTTDQVFALCRAQGVLAATLGPGFVETAPGTLSTSVSIDRELLVARAFIDSASPDLAFLVLAGGSPEHPRQITVSADRAEEFSLACHDALEGRSLIAGPARTIDQTLSQSCSVDTEYALVSVRRGDVGQRLYESVSVTGRGGLRVEEIIARWQQYREAQRRSLDNYSAQCLLSLHFEPTTLGSGFDIAMQLRVFADRTGQRDWVQDAFFVNGVRYKSSRGFPLPQLEPEKVLAQPLELAIEDKYRYVLLGTDTVRETLAYVIGVEPEQPGAMLFTGKIWIDGVSFRQVRMQLQQSGGRTSIVSHVETQDFGLIPGGQGQQFNVMQSIYVQQILNAAGRNYLLERTYEFSGYRFNSPTFEHDVSQALASDLRMFRETDEGLRVLRSEHGTRVVEPASSRIKSLIMGALYDGTFDFPVPLAGLNLVDFNFRKSGAQLSLFFAGPIVASNLSKQISQRWRLGVDVALSAIPRNDRVYVGSDEIVGEALWNFEESVGVLTSWQIVPNLSLSGSSYLTVNVFRPTEDTAPGFQASGQGFTVQTVGAMRFAHNGFTVSGDALQGTRLAWSQIGYSSHTSAAPETMFLKYSGEFSKQFYFGRFSKISLSGGYFGGNQLDRFSRYQPSFLSRPRIRGIPAGTDAFDAVAVVGAVYGFNVFDVIKLEGMYNRAWGQNLDESHTFKAFDGVELGLGTVGPWGTFLQGTVTYAIQGNVDRYQRRWGVYMLVFRPLGD